jgi:uncharacterized protein YbaP (TraB family)
MFHKFFSWLLLPALVFGSCKAQKNEDGKSLLWRITGNGTAQVSYLFGTIHLLCPDDYLWTDAMRASLKSCKEVCFEMDMDDPEVLTVAASGMMNDDDRQLKDYFTPGQYAKLATFTKSELGVDLSLLQQVNPTMLQMLLMTKAVSCAIPVSYEANIMEEAKRAGKEIVGLETATEQLAVLNTLNDDSMIDGLMQMTDSFEASKAAYRMMLSAYKKQDLPALHRQIQHSKELGDDLGIFLDDRNIKWIPRMEAKMKGKPVFFAVGAGHLWGTNGVIGLLRKRGYKVEAVH